MDLIDLSTNQSFKADDAMHRANNAVIMQTEQLGRIEALEEELRSSKVKVIKMEQKMTEQDRVIAQLVGDNLDHLQDNMRLTAHINSSNAHLEQMEHRLGQVGSVVMGFLEGRLEGLMEEELEGTESSLSSDQGTSGASGEDRGVQASGEDNRDDGVSPPESTRRVDSPMPPTTGLIASMERDAEEAGLGGWFNGNLEDVPESWSGSNSGASASQDQVGVTLLTTIGGRTLPNPVRVPDNMVHSAVLTTLMEGPVRPWQCLVWSETSPPRYSRDLLDDHTSHPGGVLLQVGPSLIDIDGEFRGDGFVEETEENEGGDVSVE